MYRIYKRFLKTDFLVCASLVILYFLWVLWMRNYWLLAGIVVIVDMFITRRVNWFFWKDERVVRNRLAVEWIDAVIFGIIVATFIRVFFIEAYSIPTSSMERSLIAGDYLFVSKIRYHLWYL